jgi:hypothetical protein
VQNILIVGILYLSSTKQDKPVQQQQFFQICKFGRVVFTAQSCQGGFILVRSVYLVSCSLDINETGPLRTARGAIRHFMTLDAIARLLREHGIESFEVFQGI